MNVLAVVEAGGSRSPGDPDALTPLAGVPMVVRAVRAVLASGVADRVVLRGDRVHDLVRACSGLPVEAGQPVTERVGAHAGQRRRATNGDEAIADGFVIVHDAVRPLAPPGLFRAVLVAARDAALDSAVTGPGAVVPVLPLVDTVKTVDGAGLLQSTPDRSGLRVVQTPQAFRARDLAVGRTVAGARVVAGDPLAFAVRTPWDLEMAELLLEEGP